MTRDEIEALFEGLNPGDEIELTFCRRVLESSRTCLSTKEPGGGFRNWWSGELDKWEGAIRVTSRALLPEPPKGSVVLDRSGNAYQRGQYTWEAATIYRCVSWESLNTYYGPVRVVYTPGEVS